MKYLNMVKYRLFDMKDSLIIYYIIILTIQFGKCIVIIQNKDKLVVPEVFVATAIFLFVAGLNSFKPQLKFFTQNGFSRQNIYWSFTAFLPITILIAVVDYAIYSIQLFAGVLLTHETVTYADYCPLKFNGTFGNAQAVLITILTNALIYAAVMSLGYMVSAMFYRLNKIGKILVAVTIPSALVFTSIISEISGIDGPLISFAKAMLFGSPYKIHYLGHFVCVLVLSVVLFLSASHLLIRKAPIKQ